MNELGNAVANQVGSVQSDGGSAWIWQTQPAGNRNDRRVERLRIASDGVITGRGELRLTEGTGAVSNGDEIGSLMFTYPSNDNKNAKIVALQNAGTSGADLAFFTRTQGDGTNADGGTEKLRINSDGRILVGHNSARVISTTVNPYLQLEGTQYNESAISVTRNTNDAYGSYLILGKSRATSNGGNAILQDNDIISEVRFAGSDGNDMVNIAAQIRVEVDGTPQTGQMPGAMIFYTNAGSTSATERLRITSAGTLIVKGDDDQDNLSVTANNNTEFAVHQDDTDGEVSLRAQDPSGSNNAKYMTFFTQESGSAAAERLRISVEGYVTKPQHPGFFAHMNGGNQTTNANSVIPFDQTHFNNGGHFKTSGTNAYKFVCPVHGIYQFSGAMWMKNQNTGAHARWQIRKNNSIICQAGWHQNVNNNDFYDHSAPATVTIECNANDTVYAYADYQIQYWRGGSSHPHSYFSGHLVG